MGGPPFATGLGYDVHRFAPGRRLVLGASIFAAFYPFATFVCAIYASIFL